MFMNKKSFFAHTMLKKTHIYHIFCDKYAQKECFRDDVITEFRYNVITE